MQRGNWKPYRLDQLGYVGRGRSRSRPRNNPALYGGAYPLFETGDIKSADLYLSNPKKTYNEKGLAQSKLWNPGTVCITIAANIAETAILKIKACFPDSVVGFVADLEKADARFIKYYIDFIKLQMQNISHGTTQDNLSVEKLLTFDFFTPPLSTQRKIAAILGNYDDLIENNTRRIKILEEMAQTIYREWFVEFRFPGHENVKMVESELGLIPQGWEIGQLSDVVENTKAHVKPGKQLEGLPYVPIDCIPRRSIALTEYKPYTEAKSSLIAFKRNDILFGAMRSYFHKVVLAPFDGITRQTCFVLRSRDRKDCPFNLFTTFQDSTIAYSSNHSTGSTIPYTMWDGALAIMPIVKPPDRLIQLFSDIVSPMLELIQKLSMRNTILRKNRDLLLPKLISGELDVSDLDINTDTIQSSERNSASSDNAIAQ